MSTLSLIFDVCTPRADSRRESFAPLVQVVDQAGMPAYLVPSAFFAIRHPTLHEDLCGPSVTPVGHRRHAHRRSLAHPARRRKDPCLISLVHAVRGIRACANVSEFIDPALLPTGPVRIAALDAESSDPADGFATARVSAAYTLWGEMAYQLAGARAIAASRRATAAACRPTPKPPRAHRRPETR